MNQKDGGLDTIIGYFIFAVLFVIGIFMSPIYLTVIISGAIIAFIIFTASTSNRDEYYKSRQNLMLTVGGLILLVCSFYFLIEDDFTAFYYNQDFFIEISLLMVVISGFSLLFYKKMIPFSFLKEDSRFVQQTMYKDYNYIGLKDRFAYRGVKFLDKNFTKFTPNTLKKVKNDFKSTELDIFDLEVEAVNKTSGELQFYYQKLIYDFYNDLFFNKNKNNQKLLKMYGYNLSIIHNLKNIEEFKEALKKESLLYYKIYYFLELDIKKIKIKINFEKIYYDNKHCLELTLIGIIQLVRFYSNFPVGDLGKYCETIKDHNFLSAFSSLPTDIRNIKSTTIAPMGIGYYYIFYQLHLDWLNKTTNEEFIRIWGS